MLTKEQKDQLIMRTLALKHKLKVHKSMKFPETHEELSQSTIIKWGLENELTAIESILEENNKKEQEQEKARLLEKFKIKFKNP